MKISVILCTYNRFQSLLKTLGSVAASTVPSSVTWEVLVVDNNSTDHTSDVVRDFSRQYPGRFCYLFEPQQGKSYALNAGIRAARGNNLAFVDDDVTVEPTWLQNLTAALDDGQWAGTGGRILPPPTFSFPYWLANGGPYLMGGPLGIFDCGPEPGVLTTEPFGANMAFRKAVFEKYGGFRTDLGPPPANFVRGEDTEFCQRLQRMGERLRYEPSAVVYHHEMPERQLKREYILAWYFVCGRSLIRIGEKKPCVWGVPGYQSSIPRMIGIDLFVQMLRWMLTLDPRRRFFWKSRVWMMAGNIVEICRMAREEKKQRAS
jgi:glucosyl-dolichyl phosphate glucuronosyltransferase